MTWEDIPWRRMWVTVACLAMTRLVYEVPVLGVNPDLARQVIDPALQRPGLFGLAVGHPFSTYGIAYLGIFPYVQACILLNLLTFASRRVQQVLRSGDYARRLELLIRALTVFLCVGGGLGEVRLLEDIGWTPQVGWLGEAIIALQMVAGTMSLLFLCDLIDEFGLGFGAAPFLLYAFLPVPTELSRLSALIADAPSVEALYAPLALFGLTTVLLVVAAVAVTLAWRAFPIDPRAKGKDRRMLHLPLVTTGIFRPILLGSMLYQLPGSIAGAIAPYSSQLGGWLSAWQPYGPDVWIDVAYLTVESVSLLLICMFVAAFDAWAMGIPRWIFDHTARLGLITGVFLVLALVVAPALDHVVAFVSGIRLIPVSGSSVVFITVVVALLYEVAELRNRRMPNAVVIRVPTMP